jgi:hypothetical protein
LDVINQAAAAASLDLYWIPLGAGQHVVRASGRIFETVAALVQHRPRRDLYHSALVANTRRGRYFMEMTPVPDDVGREQRGVVSEGSVGSLFLGRFRIFRYELRRWQDGVIPDISYAVDSPVRISDDEEIAQHVVDLIALVPTPVWGRDELRAGEMWNSNSVVSWVLERASVIERAGVPPRRGRAPGWDAGVRIARRSTEDNSVAAHATSASDDPVALGDSGLRGRSERRDKPRKRRYGAQT